MAKTANINICIDSETKAGVEKLFASFGITLTDSINILLRKSIMEGDLPFEMKPPRYNGDTEAAMQKARDIMNMYGVISTNSYFSSRELFAELDVEMASE